MNENTHKSVLLTTLWFTETTIDDGTPFTPEPETVLTAFNPDTPDGDENRKRWTLEDCINSHNKWADEHEGRPRVKFTKQQVVVITPPECNDVR